MVFGLHGPGLPDDLRYRHAAASVRTSCIRDRVDRHFWLRGLVLALIRCRECDSTLLQLERIWMLGDAGASPIAVARSAARATPFLSDLRDPVVARPRAAPAARPDEGRRGPRPGGRAAGDSRAVNAPFLLAGRPRRSRGVSVEDRCFRPAVCSRAAARRLQDDHDVLERRVPRPGPATGVPPVGPRPQGTELRS